MALSKEDRDVMVKLHIEKSHGFLNNADTYFGNGDLSTSANRYYYACFHAIHALFVANGIITKSHDGLNAQFNLNFIKTNILDKRFGAFVARMENIRNKADYDVLFSVSEEDLTNIKPLAHQLIESIEEILS